VGATKVWELGITGKGVDVAVIDTGINDEHPALVVTKEIDYTGEGTDDLNGHGTHVAGTIASTDSTYKGVAYESRRS
jgi:subtilisin family serine protease